MNDGEKIVGQFPFGTVFNSIENHEFATVVLEHVCDEFDAKAGKAVLVGNHNRELCFPCQSDQ